jgi:ketosteroid isomerase-like protein
VSEENVEIVRRANALTNEGDLDAAFQLLDPDIEWVIAREHPNARTLTGQGAVGEYQRDWQEMLPGVRVEFDRVLDAGAMVVGIGNVRGTGSGSGADVIVPIAFLFTLRDGLITRVAEYLNPSEALTAAGLDPKTCARRSMTNHVMKPRRSGSSRSRGSGRVMPEKSPTPDLVALTRQAIDASRRGDYDAAMGLFAPDVVWESLDGLGMFEGAAAVRGFLEDFRSGYESFETEPEEILDMGRGIVFVVIRHTGRVRGGAGAVEGRFAWAIGSEQGLVVHVKAGSDIGKVRRAAERLAEERK